MGEVGGLSEAERPRDEGGFLIDERIHVLCRTCMRPITYETRTEPGFRPRTGWYDDARSEPLVCFKAAGYQHVPLSYRENAYYEAGRAAAPDALREAVEALLAELPMDSTGHVVACGYSDETLGGCDCYTLPTRLRAVLAERPAAASHRGALMPGRRTV